MTRFPFSAIAAGLCVLAVVYICRPARAHDAWANGDPVPDFVRRACCGKDDVHHLRPEQVHLQLDGYHVDGLKDPIPASRMEPSLDGDWWVFYRRFEDGTTSTPYCFFGPFSGT